tara:strand:- start:877 stop:3264 length:2388 start_codon:yes stop_codon:yes gene_type:complete
MRRLFIALFIIFPSLIFSQEKNNPHYTISGKIIDASTQLPLEDATILFKSLDSNQIKFGGITNARGKFSIDVPKGTYNASVEFLSFQTKKLNISIINRDLNIGTIQLELDTEFLDEIEIIGEKSTLEFKANKLVYNVGKDISTDGGVATDILNNIPSVNVDPNGSISLRGQNVTIYINGRTSSLSKNESLKTLPAGSIEKIEVITSPGAKYKASSTGVINITLKKGKDEGLNASITTSAGYKDYYGGLLTLNHKSKSLNFFTNTSFSQSNPITTSNNENEYFNNGITTSFLNENSDFNNKRTNFQSTIGAEFYISKNTILTSTINYTKLNFNTSSNTLSKFFDASKSPTYSNNRDYIGNFDNEIMEFDVNFEHNFKKEGRKISSYFTYSNDEEYQTNTINNSNISFRNEDYIEKTDLNNKLVGIAYQTPINNSSSFSLGYDGEFGKVPFKNTGITIGNNLDYSEDVHQAYLDFEYEGEKLYFNGGLRGEFTETTIDYIDLNTILTKKYNNVFPSVYLDYTFNDSNSLSLSYKKGISRPIPSKLQPFEEKISETSFYKGNEDINPIYFDYSNVSYVYSSEKITLSTSLFFWRFNDYWQDVTFETGEQINGTPKLLTTPINLGKVDYYGIDITSTFKVSNMLNFTAYATVYNFDQTGTFETVNTNNETIILDYNFANLNGNFSILTQLKIPNAFNFQINAKHYLESEGAYSIRKAYTFASAAINKDLFKKNATISLTVDDIFISRITNRDRFDTNYFSKSTIQNKYRTIILSFTYRFNQSKKDRRINFDKKEIKPNY